MANTGLYSTFNDLLFCPLPTKKIYSASSLADATLVKSASDRQERTESSYPSYWADITETGKVTHVFIQSKDVDTIQIFDGADRVANVNESTWRVETEQGAPSEWTDTGGIQSWLIPLNLETDTDFRTTNLLKIDFTGSGFKILQIAPLFSEKKYRIKAESDTERAAQLTQLDIEPVLRNYATRRDMSGNLSFLPPINAPPVRHHTQLSIFFYDYAWQTLINFFSEHRSGFSLCQEYGRLPKFQYTKAGLHPDFSIAISKLVNDLKRYEIVSLTIAEA